jgi:membrane protease subunit (stomatin/prohibitin family)
MAKSKSSKDESKPKLIVKKWGTPQPILIGTPRFGMAFIQGFGDYSYTIANVDKNSKDDYPDIDEHIRTILLSALQESLTRFSKTRLALEVIGNTRSVAKETFEIAKKRL